MMPLFQEELVRMHVQEIQTEAAERRRPRGTRERHSARVKVGTLLIALGETLTRDAVAVPQSEPCLSDGC